MIKDVLESKEPIAYRCLKNALVNKRIAHSYLFSGDLNPLKLDAAYLLAQSIIEDQNDFACEECNTCKRIRKNEYFDVIYIDGYKGIIKKEYIENMMEEFSRTSLEKSGKKVYIISNINNSSTKVLNMILKFMEEPSSDNVFGIFITDNKEDLLPTIVSRCENIPFLTRDFSFLINSYLENGFEYVDAYLLSEILHRFDSDFDLNDSNYLYAKEYVYKTIDLIIEDKDYLPSFFYKEIYSTFSKHDGMPEMMNYYLSIMIKMIEDSIAKNTIDDDEYNVYLTKLSGLNRSKLLEIFESKKDKLLYNPERKLLFDQIAFEIISYI